MIFLQKRKSFYLYRLRTTNLNKTFLSMFRKIYLTAFLTLISSFAFAQTGTLKGVITNRATGAPVDFANVVIMKNGVQKGGTSTGLDGSFTIKPIDPGTYTVKASFAGYTTFSLEGLLFQLIRLLI